jgi:hypothetical protein
MIDMRYWYDWEFLDTGSRIRPISIGMVAEDGRELYLVNEACAEGDFAKEIMQHPFLADSVVPHLPLRRSARLHDDGFNRLDGRKTGFRLDRDDNRVVPLRFIRNAVRDFLAVDPPRYGELWGYFPAYDHVLLAQLWGPMSEMPRGIPMRTSCIAQYADMLGIDSFDEVPMLGTRHNALDDARWTRDCWRYLERLHTHGSAAAAQPADLSLGADFRHLDGEAPPLADMEVRIYRGGILRQAPEPAVMHEPDTCPDGTPCPLHAYRHVHPVEMHSLRPDGILPLPPEE